MIRGAGFIPDLIAHVKEDCILRPLTAAKVGGVLAPSSVDLTPHIDRVRDQYQTSSCVGHAVAEAIGIRTSMLGVARPFPSPAAIYAAARAEDDRGILTLQDSGCRPRAAMVRVSDPELSCLVDEDVWPLDVATIGDRLPLDLWQKADGLAVNWHRIMGSGPDRCAKIIGALASGMPCMFGAAVDEAFENLGGSGEYTPGGKIVGNHGQTIVGYTQRAFVVLNSWGIGWGDGGLSYWGYDTIGSDRLFDIYAIETGIA